MSDIDEAVSQALAAMDVEDAEAAETGNVNDKGNEDGKEDKPAKDVGADKSGVGDDDKKGGKTDKPDNIRTKDIDEETEEPSDKAPKADREDDEEGQFTADDALEVEEAAPVSSAPTDQSGVQLNPAEQKYIVDNIGDPLVLNGYRIDKDGNQVEYQVKAYNATNIPADFKFNSDADALAANNAFNSLEQKANNLLQEKRQNDSRAAAADFERRENESIRNDVADLQKEGRMPKFRVKPGEVGFDEDPAAQIMDDVLKIMADKNAKYLEDFNTKNRAYRHIGYEQAFDIWERTNPQRKAARERDDAQDKEDKERKGKAERSTSNRGDAPRNIMKAEVPSGLSTRELMALLDEEEL